MLLFLSWGIEVFKAARNKLTVTSIQQHVPTPPSQFLSLSFPLNLKQIQKQLYVIKEVHWGSGPQMVMQSEVWNNFVDSWLKEEQQVNYRAVIMEVWLAIIICI